MKGILFTELIEMMEGLLGLELTNKVIDGARLKNGGAYTSIGTYSHTDLTRLLESLGQHVHNPKEVLLKSYGEYLFHRSSHLLHEKIIEYKDTFSLLLQLQSFIDMEVRKLYPNAPTAFVEAKLISPHCLHLIYHSKQNMSFLLEGVILGSIGYFQESITVTREEFNADHSKVRFKLEKKLV